MQFTNSDRQTEKKTDYYYYTTSVQRPFIQDNLVSRHQKGKPFWIYKQMIGWQ